MPRCLASMELYARISIESSSHVLAPTDSVEKPARMLVCISLINAQVSGKFKSNYEV